MSTTTGSTSAFTISTSKYLTVPFQQLAEQRSFAAIERALYKERNDEALCLWLEHDLLCNNPSTSETPLHRIAANQPPASLVDILLDRLGSIYPNSALLDATDASGQTPLHVAAACGSIEIIALLAYGNSSSNHRGGPAALAPTIVTAPLIPDVQGRTALHWMCSHSHLDLNGSLTQQHAPKPLRGGGGGLMRNLFSKVVCSMDKYIVRDVKGAVRLLLDVYPEAVLIRDVKGWTPLDVAIAHGADPLVVKMVHETTLLFNRNNVIGNDTAKMMPLIEEYRDATTEPTTSSFECIWDTAKDHNAYDNDLDDDNDTALAQMTKSKTTRKKSSVPQKLFAANTTSKSSTSPRSVKSTYTLKTAFIASGSQVSRSPTALSHTASRRSSVQDTADGTGIATRVPTAGKPSSNVSVRSQSETAHFVVQPKEHQRTTTATATATSIAASPTTPTTESSANHRSVQEYQSARASSSRPTSLKSATVASNATATTSSRRNIQNTAHRRDTGSGSTVPSTGTSNSRLQGDTSDAASTSTTSRQLGSVSTAGSVPYKNHNPRLPYACVEL